jgi:hypothetical protein
MRQAQKPHSPTVAACLARHHEHLIRIKRDSISSLANMAGVSIDLMLEARENRDDAEMIAHGKRFIETARGFAKLLKDFSDAREAP